MDTYRDDRSDRGTSLRKAWREIGDNADRGSFLEYFNHVLNVSAELQTRDAFLENLRTHILSPLLSLKVKPHSLLQSHGVHVALGDARQN